MYLIIQFMSKSLLNQSRLSNELTVIIAVVKYRLNIHTGTEKGGECDSHVHVRLSGDRGTSGVRILKKELQGLTRFTSAQVTLTTVFAKMAVYSQYTIFVVCIKKSCMLVI
jgi:hypothetical protein